VSSRYNGGDFGFLARNDQRAIAILGKPFFDAVFALSVNSVKGVIESNIGYHIVKVTAHYDPKLLKIDDPIDPASEVTVREYIRNGLLQQNQEKAFIRAVEEISKELYAQGNVVIFEENIPVEYMGSRRKGRILAFQALFSWDFTHAPWEELSDFPWFDLEKREASGEDTLLFARLILKGTLDNIEEVDRRIKSHLENWDFDRLSRVDLSILRMSVYSLCYQKDIPPTVTIDEAIDIAKEYSTDESYRFINGVLDGIHKGLKETI
jgi:N utilization substance protein B